jgi:transposase
MLARNLKPKWPNARPNAGSTEGSLRRLAFQRDENSNLLREACVCLRGAERHGFEYFRHGTLSLYAAFNTKTGEVIDQPRGKEIHVIADNLSACKSRPVTDFLAVRPKVHLHFTPTYTSWLNQVELWFSKIERDVIARGVFTSVSDLNRKLLPQTAPALRFVSGNGMCGRLNGIFVRDRGVLRNPAYRGVACFGKTRISARTRVMCPQCRRGTTTPRTTAGHQRPREEWTAQAF